MAKMGAADRFVFGGIDGADLMAEAFAQGFEPPPRLSVTAWADAHRRLPTKGAGEPGPWRTSRVPYAAEIMDCLSAEHPAKRIVFMKSVQSAGTEIGNNWVGWFIDTQKAPMMIVQPTLDMAERGDDRVAERLLEHRLTLDDGLHQSGEEHRVGRGREPRRGPDAEELLQQAHRAGIGYGGGDEVAELAEGARVHEPRGAGPVAAEDRGAVGAGGVLGGGLGGEGRSEAQQGEEEDAAHDDSDAKGRIRPHTPNIPGSHMVGAGHGRPSSNRPGPA